MRFCTFPSINQTTFKRVKMNAFSISCTNITHKLNAHCTTSTSLCIVVKCRMKTPSCCLTFSFFALFRFCFVFQHIQFFYIQGLLFYGPFLDFPRSKDQVKECTSQVNRCPNVENCSPFHMTLALQNQKKGKLKQTRKIQVYMQ